MLQFTVKM